MASNTENEDYRSMWVVPIGASGAWLGQRGTVTNNGLDARVFLTRADADVVAKAICGPSPRRVAEMCGHSPLDGWTSQDGATVGMCMLGDWRQSAERLRTVD